MSDAQQLEKYNNIIKEDNDLIEFEEMLDRISKMSRERKLATVQLLEEQQRRKTFNKLKTFFYQPNTNLSIEHYKKHKEFFDLGKKYKIRLFMAGNRIGKTEGGGLYETVLHALGWYPEWWQGKRMDDGKDKVIIIVSKNLKASKEIIQTKLLKHNMGAKIGTGLLPIGCIKELKRAQGIADCLDNILIERECGGQSRIVFKSAEQGRGAFEGFEADIVLLDEEQPVEVFSEAITRTMTTKGIVLLTFTPLDGPTKLILEFLKTKDNPDSPKVMVQATWWDVPHLSEQDINEMLNAYPEHEREARSRGIPMLGAGAIYPLNVDYVKCKHFDIPEEWPCWYAVDVGWQVTAVVFLAYDTENDIIYVYDELYIKQQQPDEYVERLLASGASWQEGVIDFGANSVSQRDGISIRHDLNMHDLVLHNANKKVEFGIHKTFNLFKSHRLKIFETCVNLIEEFGLYQRDEKGRVKDGQRDHALDALRYGVLAEVRIRKRKYENMDSEEENDYYHSSSSAGFFAN